MADQAGLVGDFQNRRLQVRHKIRSTAELVEVAEQARAAGQSVVLCHGVFDLLHLGHVRHIEAARREGEVLMVTLTADRFVNKGPGRPVFSEILRAEMVAALEFVDWVAVNYAPTATELLTALKPDVYVKGGEYRNPEEDVTGKIAVEAQAQAAHGGRIVFTEEITYSSSALMNRHLNIYNPVLQRFLSGLRDRDFLQELLGHLEGISRLKVLIIGDAILDEYQYVEPMGKSAKETMIATRHTGMELFAGGVFATANHMADFVQQVDLLTCLGEHDRHEDFVRSRLKQGVTLHALTKPKSPTTRKCRFVDNYSLRKLFEVCHLDDRPLSGDTERSLLDFLTEKLRGYDLVVVNDFGHGLLSQRAIHAIVQNASCLCVNAQTNSANYGYNLITRYPRADYVCLDSMESRLAVHDKHSSSELIVGELLPERMNSPRFAVTQGRNGCLVYSRETLLETIPSLTDTIVDTMGAGDAFFALTSPLVAVKAPMVAVGFLGNAAGAMKVGILGHRSSIEKSGLIKFITSLLK